MVPLLHRADGGSFIETYITVYTAYYKSLSLLAEGSCPTSLVPSPLTGAQGAQKQHHREPHHSSATTLTGDSFPSVALPICAWGQERPQAHQSISSVRALQATGPEDMAHFKGD